MMNPSSRSARCAVTYSPSIRILGTMIHPSSDPVPIPAAKSANISGGSRPILGTCEARKGRGGLLRARRERPRGRRAAECDQQFPPSDGDCHPPLPCEVRKGNDTTSRARGLHVQGGQEFWLLPPRG